MSKNVEASALKAYCISLLTGSGVDTDCAEAVAENLVDADLAGVGTHGVSRMAIYMERMEKGLVSKQNHARIIKESPSAVVIDAGNSLGAVGATFAMDTCIRKAKESGCCFATVRNANHFGTAGYYVRRAAENDMIGFTCTNLKGKIAPFGGAEPFMGTDPIAVSAPSNDLPLVLDMCPSVVALGKLILAQKLGKEIPEGWALDKEGNPTTDPAKGREGSLVPLGGPKGSGLAIMAEVLSGVLSGAGYGPHLHDLYAFDEPQGIGHFMGAIDIAHFIDTDVFKSTLSSMVREIKGMRRAEGFDEILLPGEQSQRRRMESLKDGIELPDQVFEELQELGKPYGLSL